MSGGAINPQLQAMEGVTEYYETREESPLLDSEASTSPSLEAERERREAEELPVTVNPQAVQLLMDMGFSKDTATAALIANRNDIEQAMNALLNMVSPGMTMQAMNALLTMDETAEIVPSSIATKGVVASVASRGTTSRGEASLRLS